MSVTKCARNTLGAVLMLFVLAGGALGMEFNDSSALKGLTEGKGVFLVDTDSPEKAALYMDVIKGTYQSMVQQKVKPDLIVVFIGPTVRFLSKEPSSELSESGEALTSIASSVKELDKLGVKLEICAIATDFFKVSNDALLPELNVIGNGFNSLIGYQNKGYGLVPIF